MKSRKLTPIGLIILSIFLFGCHQEKYVDSIDWILDRPHNIPPERCPRDCQRLFFEEECFENVVATKVDFVIRDDLSILWTLPIDSVFYRGRGLDASKHIRIFTDDGAQVDGMSGFFSVRYIRATDIIRSLVGAYPQQPCHIIIILNAHDRDYREYIYIDISSICVIVEGDEVAPDTIRTFERQWVPREITLKDERYFQAGAYYLLTSYESAWCRKCPPYTVFGRAIFKVNDYTDIISNRNNEFGHMNSGGLYLNNIRLQEIFIEGDADGRLIIRSTPISEGRFLIERIH